MVLFYKNPAFWQFKKRSVVDEYKKQRYTIEHTFYGRNPTFPLAKRYHDVSIKDAVGTEVVRMERTDQDVLNFHIWIGDEKVSSVERYMRTSPFHYDYPGLGWKMEVEPLKRRYTIQKEETMIATVQYMGRIGRMGYEMDIPNPANAELVIAAVVAMHIIEEKVAQRHHQRSRYHRYRHHH